MEHRVRYILWSLAIAGFCLIAQGADTQAMLAARLPEALKECYNDTYYLTKDNLLPMTMNTLISLIRKAEYVTSTLNPMDINGLTQALLGRFRFDGIQRNPEIVDIDGVIPYSASGQQFFLYRVLFHSLIPNPRNQLPNETFTLRERCTLHSMLSLSIDPWDRHDGDDVCSNLEKHPKTNQRIPRSIEEEAEIFIPNNGPDGEQAGNFQHVTGNLETDFSPCPLENGVVYDRNGAISPGVVLAGIATGLQPQSVASKNLMDAQPATGRRRRPSSVMGTKGVSTPNTEVLNTFAATLSGILAENALLQGPKYGDSNFPKVIDGGWNDTSLPKYYFLTEQTENGLTTSKIRGAIDGYVMATNIKKWNQNFGGNLKLSDVLTMYYTEYGVFSNSFKASNRKDTQNLPIESALSDQVYSFALVLQDELPISVSVTDDKIKEYCQNAANDFISNIVPELDTDNPPSLGESNLKTIPAADIHVVIDYSWDYYQMQLILDTITSKLFKFVEGSNFTLINGQNGSITINSSSSYVDFYSGFNQTSYSTMPKGFDMKAVMLQLQQLFKQKLMSDKIQRSNGGLPRVVVFVPTQAYSVPDGDKDTIGRKFDYFKTYNPDVKFLFLTAGSADKYIRYVDNKTDIYQLSTTNIVASTNVLLDGISKVPRRIVNPNCGSSWSGSNSYGTATFDEYLLPRQIHFYKLDPNYFFKNNNGQLNIQGDGATQLTVCRSRYNSNPLSNNTSGRNSSGEGCSQASSGTPVTISVQSLCSSADYAKDCNPLYISVSLTTTSSQTIRLCQGDNCPTPDSTKYTVSHQGLGCYSGVARIILSPYILFILAAVYLYQYL